jgi:predicted nucleotidyltransferase
MIEPMAVDDRLVDSLRRALSACPEVEYALLFGSYARSRPKPGSDLDIALALAPAAPRRAATVGAMVALLEAATAPGESSSSDG